MPSIIIMYTHMYVIFSYRYNNLLEIKVGQTPYSLFIVSIS